jgi:predicted ATPase
MKIRIQNFRSLSDTGWISIKPITFLIGKNSSGKSSFLRHFPMLKQSFEEKTKVPLLFYGRYVDFGSYKDIRPFYKTEKDYYKLGFRFNLNEKMRKFFRFSRFYRYDNLKNFFNDNEFEINLSFMEYNKGLMHINKLELNFFNNKIVIDIEKNKVSDIIFNGTSIKETKEFNDVKNLKLFERNGLIPEFYILKDNKEENFFFHHRIEIIFDNSIEKFIKNYNRKNISESTLEEIKEKINIFDFINSLRNKNFPKTWLNNIDKLQRENKEKLDILYKLYMLKYIFIFLSSLNNYINEIFKKSSYIAPLRATAERYYRIQHLSIDEVDPNGKNLPFFLDSLSDNQMKEFQDWTNKNFKFKVFISKIEGHYSIKIEENNKSINLSDMGFGYSQILPIIVQLWYSAFYEYKKMSPINRIYEKIIVIEQPELHLHPKFQALFAEVLVKLIKDSRRLNLKLIIETHSDTIINRVGDCIALEEITNKDVNVVIFNKNNNEEISRIKEVSFNENGEIFDWPLGFFAADEIGNYDDNTYRE